LVGQDWERGVRGGLFQRKVEGEGGEGRTTPILAAIAIFMSSSFFWKREGRGGEKRRGKRRGGEGRRRESVGGYK
jgi:hypothetical protein